MIGWNNKGYTERGSPWIKPNAQIPTGSQPFHEEGTKRKTFAELPISKVTLRGLDAVSVWGLIRSQK